MRTLTWTNTINLIKTLIDIGVIWLIFYYTLKIVRNNARTIQIFKGVLIVFILKGISDLAGLNATSWLADMFVNFGFIAVIIIFQPEIRTLLEKLGQSNVLSRMTTLSGNELNNLVNSLVDASVRLSKEQIGALITIEQGQSLTDYIKTGTRINAAVSSELLCSIFVPLTPLHDGAVIIQGNHIACASAYFPPTSKDLPTKYGARHRAAIGLSEINDSITIVVSEETGSISIAEGGKLIHVDEKSLREYLLKVICVQEIEAKPKAKAKGIKFDFMPKEEVLENDEQMNVMKSSKKTKTIDPSFAQKPKRKKVITVDIPEKGSLNSEETPLAAQVSEKVEKIVKTPKKAKEEVDGGANNE